MDATCVETDFHHSTDSILLDNGVWLITRLLTEGKDLSPTPRYRFSDHRRVGKKRFLTILNTKKEAACQSACKELLQYAGKAREYALAYNTVTRLATSDK